MTENKTTENKTKLNLDAVRSDIRQSLQALADKLTEALAANLKSITLVGSSLTDDFKPGKSDINTVVVMGEQTQDSFKAIAAMAKQMSKKKVSAPLLMTGQYIQRSRDVFGIEFLDFQSSHRTILGEDPFTALSFEKADVRLQCERELKATLIRLRQGYIAAAGNKRLVRDILVSAAKSLVPLSRALLWLKDIERPNTAEEVFKKAGLQFEVQTDSLLIAVKWRHEKAKPTQQEIAAVFESVYKSVDQLASIVDKLEV